jgi:hypothetical protein
MRPIPLKVAIFFLLGKKFADLDLDIIDSAGRAPPVVTSKHITAQTPVRSIILWGRERQVGEDSQTERWVAA